MMTAPAGLEEFLHEYHAVSSASAEVEDQIATKYGITWLPNDTFTRATHDDA